MSFGLISRYANTSALPLRLHFSVFHFRAYGGILSRWLHIKVARITSPHAFISILNYSRDYDFDGDITWLEYSAFAVIWPLLFLAFTLHRRRFDSTRYEYIAWPRAFARRCMARAMANFRINIIYTYLLISLSLMPPVFLSRLPSRILHWYLKIYDIAAISFWFLFIAASFFISLLLFDIWE